MELSLLLFVVFSLCLSYQAKLFSSPTIARRARNRKDDRNQFKKLVLLRAGSTLMESKEYEDNSVPCTVIVSTLFGSEFLDKKKKFILRNTTTIAELKEQIQSKFPGSPPKEMQRLFFGTNRILSDNDILGNITTTTQVTLVLDMTTGTSVYNKTMSIRQTIDAYVASTTQLSYISAMMKQLMNSESNLSNSSEMETTQLRNLYRALNQTIYESKSNAIALALEREKNPEYESEDTKPWRLQKKKALSPVWTAFAKEFDLNTRGLINLVYYSLAVLVRLTILMQAVDNRCNIISSLDICRLWCTNYSDKTDYARVNTIRMDLKATTNSSPLQGMKIIITNENAVLIIQLCIMHRFCCIQSFPSA